MVATELITGMEDIVQHIKDLEIKNKELQEENQTLHSEYHELNYIAFESGSSVEALEEENKKLKAEIKHKNEKFEEWGEENKKLKDKLVEKSTSYLTKCEIDLLKTKKVYALEEENKKLQEEIKQLEMKGNARKDIIKNMFECITADLEEVEDGFTIKRDWGHKYIDTWNEIVTQEYKDALKDINLDKHSEGIEWETDGYQFDLNYVDESEEEEEEKCEE